MGCSDNKGPFIIVAYETTRTIVANLLKLEGHFCLFFQTPSKGHSCQSVLVQGPQLLFPKDF
jgi:hypothetical protein